MDDVLQIKDLSYEKWKMKVLSQVDDALVTACLLFIEQMRSNVELSKEEKNHVKFAIQSFTEVIIMVSFFIWGLICENNVGERRIRHKTTLELSLICRFAIIDEEIH